MQNDLDILAPQQRPEIESVLGRCEYRRMFKLLDETGLKDTPPEHDELGFLIEHPNRHKAMLAYEKGLQVKIEF